jgi:hypothetical protein
MKWVSWLSRSWIAWAHSLSSCTMRNPKSRRSRVHKASIGLCTFFRTCASLARWQSLCVSTTSLSCVQVSAAVGSLPYTALFPRPPCAPSVSAEDRRSFERWCHLTARSTLLLLHRCSESQSLEPGYHSSICSVVSLSPFSFHFYLQGTLNKLSVNF